MSPEHVHPLVHVIQPLERVQTNSHLEHRATLASTQ